MPNSLRMLCVASVAYIAVLLVSAAQADDLSPEAFYGSYAGSGFTHGDVDYQEMMVRDLETEIGPEQNGFFVSWATVIRPPDGGKPRRNISRLSFVPSDRPGIYAERSASKGEAEGMAWARLSYQNRYRSLP